MSYCTQLLNAIEAGYPQAGDQLQPLIYEELRNLAAAKMAREHSGQTLQPTAGGCSRSEVKRGKSWWSTRRRGL